MSHYPVAAGLAGQGVSYVFATGYGSAGIEPDYRGGVTIKQHYAIADVWAAIENCVTAQG